MSFIDANIVVDPTTLFNDALDQLNALLEAAGLPGWNAADPRLEVIFLNTVAPIAADLATTAATVLSASFRAFGTQLYNLPYNNGTAASVYSTWTFTAPAPDSVSYLIPANTAVIISGSAFYTSADYTASEGDESATILLVASQVGTAYNDLGGINDGYPDVQLNNAINWVSNVVTTAVTSGGSDQETDEDYQDRLAAVLQLQAPRPITASDFANFVLSDIAENATGVAVGRSTAIDGYYPAARDLSAGGTGPTALTCSGSLTSGSAVVTVATPPYPYATAFPGAAVSGTGIPANTTVLASPAPTATSFTMSANATATESDETITVTSWENVERCVTTFVADVDGNALTAANMDALQAWLDTLREQNFLAFVEPPSYNTIYVTAQVEVLPAYVGSESAVCAAVQAAVIGYLNPATWGQVASSTGPNTWLNATQGFSTVRFNSLIAVIENVPGVQYVVDDGMTLGLTASPAGTADVALTGGPAPLPQATTDSIVITAAN